MNYSELIEKRAHGTFDFPMECYRIDPTHRRYVMEPHWHAEMEILRVRSGSFSLQLNKQSYLLHPNDIAIINPGVLHRGEPQDCRYDCAVFHPGMLCPGGSVIHRYLHPLTRQTSVAQEKIAHGESRAIEEAVEKLFSSLAQKTEHYEIEVFAALYEVFFALYSEKRIHRTQTHTVQDRRLAQITKLLEWISKHYTQRITLERLSRESGLNEKYLCRFFKEYTAYTPIEYINRLRVEKVIDDMMTKGLSVTEAAFSNGFNDSAYFSKVFQRIKGTQPTTYVKQLKEDQLRIRDS